MPLQDASRQVRITIDHDKGEATVVREECSGKSGTATFLGKTFKVYGWVMTNETHFRRDPVTGWVEYHTRISHKPA